MIVSGIDDRNIRERLLHDNNLTLGRAAAIARASSSLISQVHELDGKNIDAIGRHNFQHKQNSYQNQTKLGRVPQFPKKNNATQQHPRTSPNKSKPVTLTMDDYVQHLVSSVVNAEN